MAQYNFNDTTSFNEMFYRTKENFYSNKVQCKIKLNYQFNSRSILSSEILLYYYRFSGKGKENIPDRQYDIVDERIDIEFNPYFDYYLTPKFSISTGLGLGLWKRKAENTPYIHWIYNYNIDKAGKWTYYAYFNFGFVYYF